MKKYFLFKHGSGSFVVASCGLKGNHTSSGRPYELLVVVDAGVWDRAAGRALHDVLDSDMPGLPSRNLLSGLCILHRRTMILR